MQAFGDYTVVAHHEFPESSLRVLRMEPGQEIPAHQHEHSVQSYLVLEGSAEVRTNDVFVRLNQGEAVHVPIGYIHAVRPVGGVATLVSVSVPPLSAGDHIPAGEHVPDEQYQ